MGFPNRCYAVRVVESDELGLVVIHPVATGGAVYEEPNRMRAFVYGLAAEIEGVLAEHGVAGETLITSGRVELACEEAPAGGAALVVSEALERLGVPVLEEPVPAGEQEGRERALLAAAVALLNLEDEAARHTVAPSRFAEATRVLREAVGFYPEALAHPTADRS